MQKIPYEKMACNSDSGLFGWVYFYDEYLEWADTLTGDSFKIRYEDIKDVKVINGLKNKVTIYTFNNKSRDLYLYKFETFLKLLYEAIDRVKNSKTESEETNEDDLSKLERLAKLHESGALTDEEFAKAKQKILG